VLNTTTGVRKQEIPSILEQFAKTSSQLYESDGLGIGVAIAKNLLDLLGGRIQVVAGSTKGSDFIITIPVRWGARPKKVIGLSYVEPFKQHQ
jgi:K+-sensing histidine kinase KdpD